MSLDPRMKTIVVQVEYLAHRDVYMIECSGEVYHRLVKEALTLGLQAKLGPITVQFQERYYPQPPVPSQPREDTDHES
jgi:hypothetical protein